ncbi:MAG: RagB/SusD family nutrient uptake outer membrane protein [Bacteroidetes bacterium]|nr:MAG: RagB/SusD family nutrient uptake outer membrane protein [Bacteroidota bacterium]
MKKIKKTSWLLLLTFPVLLVTISGCKKYLDRKPLFATYADYQQGALEAQSFGLYSSLQNAGFSTLPWVDFNSIRGDDEQKGSSLTDGAEVNAEFETFKYTKDDWATNTYWNDHFTMINLANKELFTADSLKVTDEASLRNVGEACFFRAYSYFDLVKAYGDVPKIDFYFVNAAEGIRPKSPAAELYALMDSDLNVASKYLPLNWEVAGNNQFPGRLTRGAALTLWAQTYLFRQKWDSVVSLCNAVINSGAYSLSPNFTDIWKDGLNGAGKNGPESIFEMQSSIGANGTNYHGVPWGTCQNVRQGGADLSWNLGWGWNTPTDVLVSAWDNTDPRKQMTILFSGQSDGGPALGGYGATLPPYDALGAAGHVEQKYWNKKVYSDPQMRAFTGEINASGGADWINHRILRYADVILMLAEASNELGDGATAAANLELIRNRASGNLGPGRAIVPPIPFTSQAQMRTAIKNERRFELAMEGYRFYDLVRWGDAVSALGGLGYQPRNALYPIPQPAIDLSGGVLVQNPNY